MSNLFYVQVKEKFEEIAQERMSIIGEFINVFDSTYLLLTDKDAKQVYEFISLNDDSSMFIIKCDIEKGSYYGRANKRVWDWIIKKRSMVNK